MEKTRFKPRYHDDQVPFSDYSQGGFFVLVETLLETSHLTPKKSAQ